MKKWISIPVLSLIIIITACGHKKATVEDLQLRIDSLQTALKGLDSEQVLTHMRLERFDSLDFNIYNSQLWDQFNISHEDGVRVYYPDGQLSLGLSNHTDMLKPMFAFAPDTKIIDHRVKFGGNDWTAVIGEIQGTFTDTMSTPDGHIYPPTGKPFKFLMCTISHWEGGKMSDEYLFWDNHAFLKQIGLIQ